MKRGIAAVFGVLIIFSATILVFAKGSTTKITITSAELQRPIEITDPEILKNFNVWSGPGTFANDVEGSEGFIVDWASGAVSFRPTGLRTFELSFYVRYANRPFAEQSDQLAYIVSYAVDPASGQGYVYLPGKADEPYGLNTKAIYRGREGNWFRANAAWQSAFRAFVHG
jgi:hypothetical protein